MVTGTRVKLRCVNWVSHMQPMLAEGLDKQPLRDIASRVSFLGFNCVRLTWATYMFTKPHYSNLTVSRSLESLGLTEAETGLIRNNPSFLNLTLAQAYDVVIDELGAQGLMVVLDNHVSRPKWCCGNDDGNGFFGDRHFDPKEWLDGLNIVAKRFRGRPQVVGISMRNELRGPRQNELDWYRYVRQGARKIHKANPNLLVIVSGLNYDSDLSFLRRKTLGLNLDNKLVYEAHWYSFSEGERRDWEVQPSQVCTEAIRKIENRIGFVIRGENPVPLFMSEFGVNQRGVNRADNRFLSCFLAFVAERDLDWAMWALQGSYYLRNGQAGFEETYGVLDINWDKPRNPNFQERFNLIQQMIQEAGSNASINHILYHPLTGRCVRVDENNNSIQASNCQDRSLWSYDGDGTPIKLTGTSMCLNVVGNGLPVTISTNCSNVQSSWRVVSRSKLHLAAMDEQGRYLCLEINNLSNSTTILTKECVFLKHDYKSDENPQIQWFKLVSTNEINKRLVEFGCKSLWALPFLLGAPPFTLGTPQQVWSKSGGAFARKEEPVNHIFINM